MKLQMHGQTVTLLPQRALYLDNLDILALADVHIGKDDMGRILRLVKEMQPETLYIIGDFINDMRGLTPALAGEMQDWRKELDCAVVLIEGNHDRKVLPYVQEANMVVAQSMTVENFVFSHEPSKPDKPGQIVVSGHVRPMIADRPCFVWEEPQLILPSFGKITEGAGVRQRPEGRYFAVDDMGVIEITSISDQMHPEDHHPIN